MKQEFKMTQQEMDGIIAINKNKMPIIKIGNVTTGMYLKDKINSYWRGLGDKYGFKPMTAEGSNNGGLFFLAEPKQIIVPKTQTEIGVDKYIGNAMEHLNCNVTDSLKKIVAQLDWCDYKNEVGCLTYNIAFIALKKLAENKSVEQQ